MIQSQYPRPAVLILISCLGFAACTPGTRSEAFQTSFLPTAPKPAPVPGPRTPQEPVILEAPPLQASMFPKEVPHSIKSEPRIAPRPQLDNRLRRAEERFSAGRKLYLEGDLQGARTEFDQVIDLLLSSSESAPDRHLMEKKLEELVDKIHRYDVEGLGAGDEQETAGFDKSPLQEILELTFPIDPTIKTKVKDQVAGTKSQLPLEENDEVLRYINYFNSDRGKRTLISGLRRAGRYNDMIRRILDEEGVPQELIFLAQAESGFLPRAVSPKAAVGMWQFIKATGAEYGLKQSPFVDDRLDPETATRAGARHLRDLYTALGDWYLAMAAYNCGPNCVSKAVQRTGYADYWQLRNRNVLPKETANYVPLILAMTIMVKNAKDYGIENIDPDPPLRYDTVEMVANTNLSLVADLLDVPLTEMRDLNPALLKSVAPSGYALRVPSGGTQTLMSGLSAIPPDKRASWHTHRVVEGETLASIAKRYRTQANSLVPVNRASLQDLRTGDLVVIPATYVEPKAKVIHTATKRPTLGSKAKAPIRRVKAPSTPAHKAPARRAAVSGAAVASR